jgi:nucleoid-associated protein YgaU
MALTKAVMINTDLDVPVPIPVMFNPPEYQLQRTNQFAEIGIPGLGSSLLQFVRGSAQILTVELFFDTSDRQSDVRGYTDQVVGLASLNPKTHAPPSLLFVWGSLVFPCVLESVNQRFDYFSPTGLPLRAHLSVTLKGHDLLETLLASIPLESADKTKSRTFKQGDSLQRISAQEYDDPRKWRAIAERNGIDNPLTVQSGVQLVVPNLT